MASPARIPVPVIAVPHDALETMFDESAWMAPARSTTSRPARAAATLRPSERAIATVAYLLWRVNGCPEGTEQEDWFQAESLLTTALEAQRESRPERASPPGLELETEYEIQVEFRWDGHWESWEREWGGARWVCDPVPTDA